MKLAAQWFVVGAIIIALFVNLHRDFYGREAAEPGGFSGAVLTIIAAAISVAAHYFAGALSEILG